MKTMNVYVGKLGETVEIRLHENSEPYALQYGCNQSVNDSAAGITEKSFTKDGVLDVAGYHAAVREKITARVTQLESGNVPNLRGPAPISDTAAIAQLAKSTGLSPAQIAKFLENQAAKSRS